MAYYVRQTLRLKDLPGQAVQTVLLAGPEEELLELYAEVLRRRDFLARTCSSERSIFGQISEHKPDLAVVSLHFFDGKHHLTKLFFSTLRNLYPDLKILTYSLGSEHEFLKDLMSCGISGHLDRRLTRPNDLVLLAEHILSFK